MTNRQRNHSRYVKRYRLRAAASRKARSGLLACGSDSNIGWRRAEVAAEQAVEPRQIVESDFECDVADAQVREAGADKHPVRTQQPLLAKKTCEARPLFLEQPLHMPGREPMARGNGLDREFAAGALCKPFL